MSLVRLKCPTCSVIVKIGSEVVTRHPVVRCAKCQALVPVATSQVKEIGSTTYSDDGRENDSYDYKPRKKKLKSSRQASFPVAWIVGGLVGLIVMAGVGLGVYFLIDHFGDSGPEKATKKVIAMMESLIETMENINKPEDVEPAITKLISFQKEMKEFVEEQRKLGNDKVDPETSKRMMETYMPKMLNLQKRMQEAMVKLTTRPELAKAMMEQGKRLVGMPGMGLGMGMGINAIPNGMGNQGNDPPVPFQPQIPRNFDQPPVAPKEYSKPANVQLQELENLLLSRGTQANLIPSMLNDVRDSSSAENAVFQVEALVSAIKNVNSKIEALQRQNVRPTGKVARDAIMDFNKSRSEIAVQMKRIEAIPNLGSSGEKLAKLLREAELFAGSFVARKDNDEGGNPFESAPSKPADAKPAAKEGANPFEPASPPATKPGDGNKPAMKEPDNPFEPASPAKPEEGSGGDTTKLDEILGKLTSSEFFKKQDGLRELLIAKVHPGKRKEVLEALLNLCADRDVHQKADIIKAYKNWASTQEEKEQLGQHAESLLKDAFAKKDALRYFGENKVITASVEVAQLLKNVFDNKDAAESLIQMGSEAEKAVIPHLSDLEPKTRQMAIEVLARIGTKQSLPELQKLQNDRMNGIAARQAIRIINTRKK